MFIDTEVYLEININRLKEVSSIRSFPLTKFSSQL
jgi:hypothetical protein